MSGIGDVCDFCEDPERDCKMCSLANPCLGCEDYDIRNDTCKSKGGCCGEGKAEGGEA